MQQANGFARTSSSTAICVCAERDRILSLLPSSDAAGDWYPSQRHHPPHTLSECPGAPGAGLTFPRRAFAARPIRLKKHVSPPEAIILAESCRWC